jgi:hypothetical protein
MKNTIRITGILLMLFIAGSLSLSAQRGMRGMRPDSSEMKMVRMKEMPLMMQNPDSLRMGGMRHGMNPGRMNNMGWFMDHGWQMGHLRMDRRMRMMGPGMGRGPMGPGMGRGPMGPGMGRGSMGPGMGHPGMGMRQGGPGRIMENIPNLTEKQKKDIEGLRQKQQDETQKFRLEMQGKMKEMRESYRNNVMNLLNDEQKKWFEENTPKPLNK